MHFGAKIFFSFKMHPVSGEGGGPRALLEFATAMTVAKML